MAWAIDFTPAALKDMKALDRSVAARILETLETRIAALEDPRTLGKPLKGNDARYWRWRVGHYRVIGAVRQDRLTILVVRVAHRSAAYR